MPELPEVETIVGGLQRRVAGDTINSVWIGSRRQPLKASPRVIARELEGRRIVRVHRAGKHIVFDLEAADARGGERSVNHRQGSPRWVVHLGMTGRMVVTEPSADIAKHTHLIVKLGSGRELRFIDPRMFGKISVHLNGFDPGGFEPLEITKDRFIDLFRGRKTPIKSALLNQKLLRGVGNIYADESLFRAGIRPRRRASAVSKAEMVKLRHSVRQVLREAIALGGSSISDYVDSDGEEGFFQLQHRVYGREGEPCTVCGSGIRRVVIAGRSSHFCPKCQK